MAYADKWMLYMHKTQAHGKLEARKHIDLCKACARKVMGAVVKYCDMGEKEQGGIA